jgi:hypothetical protein
MAAKGERERAERIQTANLWQQWGYHAFRIFQRQEMDIDKERKARDHRIPREKGKPAGEVGEVNDGPEAD